MQTNYNRCNRQPFRGHRTNGYLPTLRHRLPSRSYHSHDGDEESPSKKQPDNRPNKRIVFSVFFAHIRLNLADKGKGDYFRGVIQSFLFRKFKYSTLHNGKYIPLSPIRPSRHLRNRNQNRIHHRHTPIRGIASFDDRLFSSVVPILFGD